MNYKLNQLEIYLKSKKELLNITDANIDSFISQGQLRAGKHIETVDGFSFAYFEYEGRISIDNLLNEKFELLMIFIKAWLDDFDNLRKKLPQPIFTKEKIDDNNEKVVVTIKFIDELFLTPDETGPINWQQGTFSIEAHDVKIATSGTVNSAKI